MSKKNNFIRQGSILALASIIVRFIGFLYRIPLTRMIGDEGMAIYSASFNIYMLFLIISSQSLPASISKLVSEEMGDGKYYSAHKIFKKTMLLTIIVGLISSIVLFFGASIIENIYNIPETKYAIRVLAPTVFIVGIMAVIRGYFQGMQNTIPTAISQVFEQIVNAIISVFFAYLLVNSGIEGISKSALGAIGGTSGTLFGAIVGLIVLTIIYFLVRDRIFNKINKGVKESYDTKVIYKKILITAVPIILGTAIFSVTNIIDTAMISKRLVEGAGLTQKNANILYGQYSGKYTLLANLPVSVATAFAAAGIPVIAGLKKSRNFKQLNEKINSMLRIVMILCIPASVGLAVLANGILQLLYGTENGGSELLRYGSLSIVFIGLTQMLTGILQGLSRANVPVRNALIACVIKIPLNFFLIGNAYINIYGAIISTTITYILTTFLNYKNIKHRFRIEFDFKGIIFKPTFASIVMGILTYYSYKITFLLSSSNMISIITSLIISIIAYGITLILIKGLKEEDLRALPKGYKLYNFLENKNLI